MPEATSEPPLPSRVNEPVLVICNVIPKTGADALARVEVTVPLLEKVLLLTAISTSLFAVIDTSESTVVLAFEVVDLNLPPETDRTVVLLPAVLLNCNEFPDVGLKLIMPPALDILAVSSSGNVTVIPVLPDDWIRIALLLVLVTPLVTEDPPPRTRLGVSSVMRLVDVV